MKATKEEIKLQDQKTYDKAGGRQWAVGNLVLLHDTRVRPELSQVITSKKFHGPFVIQEVVNGDPKIGQAYKLVHQSDGNEESCDFWSFEGLRSLQNDCQDW